MVHVCMYVPAFQITDDTCVFTQTSCEMKPSYMHNMKFIVNGQLRALMF